MHDVLLKYKQQEQRDTRSALHGRLLTAYRMPTWADLPVDEPYLWRWLAWHLVQARRGEELGRLLLDFDWLQAKLAATDVSFLVVDYDLAPNNEDLRLVQGCLRLAAHILAQDKTQLPTQLCGRLMAQDSTALQGLVMHRALAQRAGIGFVR